MFDDDDRAPNEHDAYPDREEDVFDPASAEEELATLSAHLDAEEEQQQRPTILAGHRPWARL